MRSHPLRSLCTAIGLGVTVFAVSSCTPTSPEITHVLLISIDGMREFDYDWLVKNHPESTLAALATRGVVYEQAFTSFPSDSYPGLLAQVTGGSPKSTGVYYDHSFDSTLFSAPASGLLTHEMLFDESLTDASGLAIDPTLLPTSAAGGAGTRIYPHDFLKVNTVFEVLHATGAVTAWSDKHPAYDLVNGPSGTGVTDLYCPEIRANNAGTTIDSTATVPLCMTYDDGKVGAIINQIDGKKSVGGASQAVPALFGMNFQAVSVAQKITSATPTAGKLGGYLTSTPGLPGGVLTPNVDTLAALLHTDASIGRIIAELKAKGLYSSTLVIISAKHGQGGLDPATVVKIAESNILDPVASVDPQAVCSDDDVGIIWMNDKSKTAAAVAALQANATLMATVQSILTGNDIAARFGHLYPNRIPDIVIIAKPGVLYSTSSKKNSDHGGASDDDTHIMCLVTNPLLIPNVVHGHVNTTQIAPTILQQLGHNPRALQAVRKEGTQVLPGIFYGDLVAPHAVN